MNLIKFTEESPDEALCKAHFRAQREQEGLTYRKCGGTHQILARRQAMGQRDDLYNLKDIIEFDEAYISVATEPKTTVKRGKGSQKKRAMWGACQSLCL